MHTPRDFLKLHGSPWIDIPENECCEGQQGRSLSRGSPSQDCSPDSAPPGHSEVTTPNLKSQDKMEGDHDKINLGF